MTSPGRSASYMARRSVVSPVPLPAYGAMARSWQAPVASDSSTATRAQREANPILLHHRLGIARLVRGRVRHGDVRSVDDEDGPAVPLPAFGEAGLQLLGR